MFFILLLLVALVTGKHHQNAHGVENPNFIEINTCTDDESTPYINCIITGHFYCKGKPAAYLRPYLTSPEYPGQTFSIAATHLDGRFKLSTTGYIPFHQPILLEVRHLCPIEGVPLKDHCSVPFFITSISVEQRNKTNVYIDVNLDERPHDSSSDCL